MKFVYIYINKLRKKYPIIPLNGRSQEKYMYTLLRHSTCMLIFPISFLQCLFNGQYKLRTPISKGSTGNGEVSRVRWSAINKPCLTRLQTGFDFVCRVTYLLNKFLQYTRLLCYINVTKYFYNIFYRCKSKKLET